MPFEPFFGDFIGFQVGGNSTIEVNYLKIKEKQKTVEIPKLMITGYKFLAATSEVMSGIPIQLHVTVKNTSKEILRDISFKVELPPGIILNGEDAVQIPIIEQNKEANLTFDFYPTKRVFKQRNPC